MLPMLIRMNLYTFKRINHIDAPPYFFDLHIRIFTYLGGLYEMM